VATPKKITKSCLIATISTSCSDAKSEGLKFTTLQLNRNYSAKLHVDGNNHGASSIIGLGNYIGGELWVMDQQDPFGAPGPGDYQLKVEETLRGWPELTASENKNRFAKGKLTNIQGTWLRFDGTVPHYVLPFRGSRISIVYFARSKYTSMRQEYRDILIRDLDFPPFPPTPGFF